MKLLLFLVVCFSIPRVTFSQNPGPNISLQKCFSTSGRDSFHAFKKLNDGNYLATAYFSEKDYFLSNDTARYFYLLKLDPNFNVIWKKSIPVYAYEIIILPNNEIILAGIAGYSSNSGNIISNIHGSPNNLTADLAVIKFDSTGQNLLWGYAYGSYSEEEFKDIIPTSDGGFMISGSTRGNDGDIQRINPCYNPFYDDALILKINHNGILEWVDVLGGSGEDGFAGSIIPLSDTTYLTSIRFFSTDCDFANTIPFNADSLNIKYKYILYGINGSKLFQKYNQTGKNQFFPFKSWIKDKLIYTIGYNYSNVAHVTPGPNHENWEASITITDTQMNFIEQKLFGGSQFDVFVDHIYDSEGNHIFLGKTNTKDQTGDIPGAKGNDFDHWLLKTDPNFNIIWSRTIGGEGNNTTLRDRRYSEMLIDNNSLIIAFEIIPPKILPSKDLSCGIYSTEEFDTTRVRSNAWLVKFDLSTGLELLNKKNNTINVFPNPTTGILSINASGISKAEVSVYTINGALVYKENLDSPVYELNLSAFEKGLYILKIKSEKGIETKKVVLQ